MLSAFLFKLVKIILKAISVSDGNGVIWYDSNSDSKGFNIIINLAGLDLETIPLSSDALTVE